VVEIEETAVDVVEITVVAVEIEEITAVAVVAEEDSPQPLKRSQKKNNNLKGLSEVT
jgi:hypothetical protein